jgi:hypothetical protein
VGHLADLWKTSAMAEKLAQRGAGRDEWMKLILNFNKTG